MFQVFGSVMKNILNNSATTDLIKQMFYGVLVVNKSSYREKKHVNVVT